MIEGKGAEIPPEYSWVVLREKSGTELTEHYMTTLRKLGEKKGMLGDIYAGAMSRFSNPVNLKRLVNLIDEVEWTGLNVDVKAAAYEGLLEKSASEGKKGAGQYFTPRILIQSIVGRSRYAAAKNLKSVYTPIFAQFRAPIEKECRP